MSKTARPHADIIKAWADGARIEFKNPRGIWKEVNQPSFYPHKEYRVAKEPVVMKAWPYLWKRSDGSYTISLVEVFGPNTRKNMESDDRFVRWLDPIETTVEQS